MFVWIGLIISAIVIVTKVTPLTTKLFFVMAVLKMLMLIGTQQTIILLGFLMVYTYMSSHNTGLQPYTCRDFSMASTKMLCS